jgi:uncharacterized protein
MKSIVAGGSGFIGGSLVTELEKRGEVVVLSRNPRKVRRGRGVAWNPAESGEWERELDGADAVINLAGENIAAKRWTPSRKKQLLESRVQPTGALVRAIEKAQVKPRVFVSTSATGIYGDRGDETLDESSKSGDDFLAALATAWEAEASKAEQLTRLVIPRFGIVLSKEGGMLERLLPMFRLHAGGQLGSGRQWMSWISRDDLVALLMWMIDNDSARGVYNATSPEPVTNAQFTQLLAGALGKTALLRAPAFPLRLALGEMADALLFASQRALPVRALREGFAFRDATLSALLGRELAQ